MEDELKSYLKNPTDFDRGPDLIIPLKRDTPLNLEAGFVVRDNNYLSARWPGDAHKFSSELVRLLTTEGTNNERFNQNTANV